MVDDFLLTGDSATDPLAVQLVAYADTLEQTALLARGLLDHDVPVVALRPEEIEALRAAVSSAHGAGRDFRLIATAVQDRVNGDFHNPPDTTG